MIRAALLALLLLVVGGCVQRDVLPPAVAALNSSARFLDQSNRVLKEVQDRARERAASLSSNEDAARAELARLRAALHPVWIGYEDARYLWLAAAALIEAAVAADAAGREPDPLAIAAALDKLAAAYIAFERAALAARSTLETP